MMLKLLLTLFVISFLSSCAQVSLPNGKITSKGNFTAIPPDVVTLQGSIEPRDFVKFTTQSGGEINTIIVKPSGKAIAAALLFTGGGGNLGITQSLGYANMKKTHNFVIRTHSELVYENILVILVDSPSDYKNMMGGYRYTSKHADEVNLVIEWVKKTYHLPVWLIGTSAGTESVVNTAWRLGDAVNGIVLSSSVTETSRHHRDIAQLPLHKIIVPSLILHNKQDTCSVTPPAGAERIASKLKNAPVVDLKYFNGPAGRGNPCKARSAHGFADIELDVIDTTTAFIKKHSK